MELTDKDIEQLEAFWKGDISETDRLALENRIETDLDFRKKAGELKLFTEGLRVLKEREMRQQIKDINNKLPPFDPPSFTNWLKIGIVALAIALAAFAVWFFMVREKVQPLSPMVAAYFEPYPALGITMGKTNKNTTKDAMILYAEEDYIRAIPLLHESFLETNDTMSLFYEGISNLAIGESQKAQNIFEQIQNAENILREATLWYLSLSYIANKQNEKAINILQNQITGKYATKAQILLKEISDK